MAGPRSDVIRSFRSCRFVWSNSLTQFDRPPFPTTFPPHTNLIIVCCGKASFALKQGKKAIKHLSAQMPAVRRRLHWKQPCPAVAVRNKPSNWRSWRAGHDDRKRGERPKRTPEQAKDKRLRRKEKGFSNSGSKLSSQARAQSKLRKEIKTGVIFQRLAKKLAKTPDVDKRRLLRNWQRTYHPDKSNADTGAVFTWVQSMWEMHGFRDQI